MVVYAFLSLLGRKCVRGKNYKLEGGGGEEEEDRFLLSLFFSNATPKSLVGGGQCVCGYK